MTRTLLIDYHLDGRIKDIIGSAGENLLYVSSKLAEIEEFFRLFPRHHKAYIGSGDNTPHHRSLIRHADAIIFGSGNITSLSLEMKREGLWKEFLAKTNESDILLAGRSAGAIYLGKLYPSKGSDLILNIGLGVLDKTIVMVHLEEQVQQQLHHACYAHRAIAGIGLSSSTGLYVKHKSLEKIGSNEVRVYEEGKLQIL